MKPLEDLLAESASRHHRLCPRQVLGARVGMMAASLLDLDLPQSDKRLLTITETDGCFVDGISAATGCYVGRRTLQIEDYGKIAATFVDTLSEQAIRIVPRVGIRELAWAYAPAARNRWEAQLIGYQHILGELLLDWQRVELTVPVKRIIGQAGKRVVCEGCGEEVINQREVLNEGVVLCKSCTGESYFRFIGQTIQLEIA